MKFFETGHEIKYLVIRRVPHGVIAFRGPDNQVDHIGEAAAAAPALFHRVIDFCRHDQLPTILIEEGGDRILYLLFGDEIATANQHDVLPVFASSLRQQ
ncbi:hypothetical protein ASG03_12190 [Rhizobium sp. Leaf341]|nr:hypothetical protein ASG03_12190 [Rhizobium sp. Leaf341]